MKKTKYFAVVLKSTSKFWRLVAHFMAATFSVCGTIALHGAWIKIFIKNEFIQGVLMTFLASAGYLILIWMLLILIYEFKGFFSGSKIQNGK